MGSSLKNLSSLGMKHHVRSDVAGWGFVAAGLAAALLSSFPVHAQSISPDAAVALEREGNFAGAEGVWKQWLRSHGRDAGAFASLGVVLSKQEKYTEASTAYRKALALNPKLAGIQLNLGLAEFKQGHFEAAIAPFKAALAEQSPKAQNAHARTLLGLSCYGAKRF